MNVASVFPIGQITILKSSTVVLEKGGHVYSIARIILLLSSHLTIGKLGILGMEQLVLATACCLQVRQSGVTWDTG